MKEEIEKVRAEIDKIDNVIVESLVKRIDCVLKIVEYKTSEEEVIGCDRVKIVLDKVRNKAVQAGGHEELIVEIYKNIIKVITDMQLEILRKRNN
ncbi:chorismate mutase [Ruminiclostridium herbifermentans]|uniref:Chorismate mutase n=1 Tax=Ruminiclostridium herbifermentans TaxID=2488810 RepID=A0A4V6EQ00_9FIRM|nr:chorismate mutase [Ruminiclostridium herbifermentans]QNU66259.1 chorismate mutase [Ruminiclostridium herbifermentans]